MASSVIPPAENSLESGLCTGCQKPLPKPELMLEILVEPYRSAAARKNCAVREFVYLVQTVAQATSKRLRGTDFVGARIGPFQGRNDIVLVQIFQLRRIDT